MAEAGISRPRARPFGFERVFAANDPERRANPGELAVQVMALRADLARLEAGHASALSVARADGFEAGLTQARSEVSSALLAASTRVADTVEELAAHFGDTEARISRAASELALAAAETLAARAIEGDPLVAIDAAIGRLLGQVGTREELRVYVHPTLSGPLRTMIGARAPVGARPLAVVIIDDDEVVPGDTRILWERGGMSLDAAARNAAVRAELANLIPVGGLQPPGK